MPFYLFQNAILIYVQTTDWKSIQNDVEISANAGKYKKNWLYKSIKFNCCKNKNRITHLSFIIVITESL